MANDMLNTLKEILGDNAEEKIQTAIQMLQSNDKKNDENSENSENSLPQSITSPDYVSQMKSIINQMGTANDNRSNLLLSLKPYMRAERQQSIDSAIKLLNLTKFAGLFK